MPSRVTLIAHDGRSASVLCRRLLRVLGLLPALRFVLPVALLQFQDGGMVYKPIHSSSRRHWIFEDRTPFGKHQIARDEHAASFISFCKQNEENVGLVSIERDVGYVVDN